MATNPMHQFQVYPVGPEIKLGGLDFSSQMRVCYAYKRFVYLFIFIFRIKSKK